jgi:hypothetical protein
MKKVAMTVLIFTMIIFLVNPLSSYARGGGRGDDWDHGDAGYWLVPLSVIVVILTAVVLERYHSHHYAPPPVVIQEQPPVHVNPVPSVPPSLSEKIFIYPKNGQSEEQQAKDRSECHSWAVGQTLYDPTQPSAGSMPEAQRNQLSADYQREMGACLDARGYTVK